MAKRYIVNGFDLSNKAGSRMRISPDEKTLVLEEDGYVYVTGDPDKDGSKRFSIEDISGNTEIQQRTDGIWHPGSFEAGPTSLWVGHTVAVSGLGHHLAVEAADGHLHFHVHSEYDGQYTTQDAQVIYADFYIGYLPVQPDASGEYTGKKFEYTHLTTSHALLETFYIKTGNTPAGDTIRFQVWEGTDTTGVVAFDQKYPAGQFPANTEVAMNLKGKMEYTINKNYLFRLSSDETFSIKTNAAGTQWTLAIAFSRVREDNLLQTKQWEDGDTFDEDQYLITNRKIYICNVTGVQTGAFASNADKWQEVGINYASEIFTEGSIPFANSLGHLTSDVDQLSFDGTALNIGAGVLRIDQDEGPYIDFVESAGSQGRIRGRSQVIEITSANGQTVYFSVDTGSGVVTVDDELFVQNEAIYPSWDAGLVWDPPSDRDCLLLHVDVDGDPEMMWDESADAFVFNKPLEYSIDHFDSIVDRSLVDKAYVDSQSPTQHHDGVYHSGVKLSESHWDSMPIVNHWEATDEVRDWNDIAASSDAQYMSATTVSGKIYTSDDSGVTWTPRESDRAWRKIAMSSDGKYQTATVYGGLIYTSSNYGVTWTPRDSVRNWLGVGVSGTGQYQTAGISNNGIYVSTNYGQTWSLVSKTGNMKSVALSSTGQYQAVAAFNEGVYVSSDYGVSFVRKNAVWGWVGVSMSSDGQYMTAVAVKPNGRISRSEDYGQTWEDTDDGVARDYAGVSMSADGQYQTVVEQESGKVYVSVNYGNFWTPQQYTKDWTGIAMTSDAKIQIGVADADYIFVLQTNFMEMTEALTYNYEWNSTAVSADGMYQVAVAKEGHYIYVSWDYGVTWTARGITRDYFGVAISSDGRYMSAAAQNNDVYLSSDYGDTWAEAGLPNANYAGVAMSSEGEFQVAVVGGYGSNGYIYVSTDFGANWDQKGESSRWERVACSDDGKYITATRYGTLYRSTDYGETWGSVNNSRSWFGIAMSANGKYQVATNSDTDRNMAVSSDYGETWSNKGVAGDYTGAAMTAEGRYQVVARNTWESGSGELSLYISDDFGQTWTLLYDTYDGGWTDVAMSSDGKYITAVNEGNGVYTYHYDARIAGNIVVGANATIGGDLGIGGDLTIGGNIVGDVNVTGDLSVQALAMTGDLTGPTKIYFAGSGSDYMDYDTGDSVFNLTTGLYVGGELWTGQLNASHIAIDTADISQYVETPIIRNGNGDTVTIQDALAVTNALSVNSVEIVGTDGEVNKAAIEDSTSWDTAYAHSQNNVQAHSDYLLNNASDETIGTLTAANFDTTGSVTAATLVATGLTQGSIPFIGANGIITEDNSRLFWDSTSNELQVNEIKISGYVADLRGITQGYIAFGGATGGLEGESKLFWDATNTRLEVGTGGEIRIADLTEGELLLGGANGAIWQNGGKLFWDAPNNRLGLGFNEPERTLHIQDDNAIVRVDRDADSPAVMLCRFPSNDYSGSPLKTFSFGVNATGADAGTFFITDFHQNVSGANNKRMVIDTDGNTEFFGDLAAEVITATGVHVDGPLYVDVNAGGVLQIHRGSVNKIESHMDAVLTDLRFMGEKDYNRIGTFINKPFQIVTNSVDRIVVGNDGKVGIGVSPTYNFHFENNLEGTLDSAMLNSNSDGVMDFLVGVSDDTHIRLIANSGPGTHLGIPIGGAGIVSDYGDMIVFSVGDSGNASEKMRLTPTGLGVGKTPAYLLDVNGQINATELFNAGGDLKIQPDVQGDVILFGDTQVDNAVDGKELRIWRRAAEGNDYMRFYITASQVAMVHGSADFKFQAQTNFTINSVYQNILFSLGDNAGAKKFHVRDSDNADVATIDSLGRMYVKDNIFLENVLGDKISLYDDRKDGTQMYGFGVEADSCLYAKSYHRHRWYIGTNADLGVSSFMELTNIGLGVGKTPAHKLDVAGHALIEGPDGFNLSGEQAFVYLGDLNNYIISEHTDTVIVHGFNGVQLSDNAGGIGLTMKNRMLGLGTPDPQHELHIESGSPVIALVDDDADSNEKVWHMTATGGAFNLITRTDAHAAGFTAMKIERNGTSITNVVFPIQVGIGTDILSGQLTIDQPSTGGAIPVLTLDQADVDHSFIDFVGGTIYTGMTGQNEYLKVKINGSVRHLRLFN